MTVGAPPHPSPPRGVPPRATRRRPIVVVVLGLVSLAGAAVVGARALATDRGVRLVPHPDVELERGACVAWCATAQSAWDGLCNRIGPGLAFHTDDPRGMRALRGLGRRWVPADAVDPASAALLVWEPPAVPTDADLAPFRRLLGEEFRIEAPEAVPGRRQVAALSALARSLPFARPFQRLREAARFAWAPLGFATGVPVERFGFDGGVPEDLVELRAFDPLHGEFVVVLRPADPREQVVVAQVEPDTTLLSTWERVATTLRRRPVPDPRGLRTVRTLSIPVVHLDCRETFGALLGARSETPGRGWTLTAFGQSVRLRIDERGAELRSTGFAGSLELGGTPPEPDIDLVVDRPFLVALRRTDADVPYLLLWVGGPAVLEPR